MLICCIAVAGCGVQRPVDRGIEQKVDALAMSLSQLDGGRDIEAARAVARRAVSYSLQLAEKYELLGPPRLHNLLVNIGVRERGLCYQWADDLLAELLRLHSERFDFYAAVANRGSNLREHNSVVVTVRGGAFASGIVLDGWRNSGDLYWSQVAEDSYVWQPRYEAPVQPTQ